MPILHFPLMYMNEIYVLFVFYSDLTVTEKRDLDCTGHFLIRIPKFK
jgi:hypothetical protein